MLLLGASLLTQVFPFPGMVRLGYWFLLVAALTSPVVIVLLLVVLELREAFYRLRVRRRAVKWKRKEPRASWTGEGWAE